MSKMSEQMLFDILNAAEYKRMPLADIQFAPYNPRVDLTPDDPEYQDIKRSILDHAMVQPIIFNKRTGYAVGGNQRLKIIRDDMGVEEATCAVVDLPLVREMEASAALNKLGNLWDREKLREIMLQMKEADYDVTATGFSDAEIDEITKDMSAAISDFFTDDDEEESTAKDKPVHTYKCPHCGEVFTH